jgi:hypothetical protein
MKRQLRLSLLPILLVGFCATLQAAPPKVGSLLPIELHTKSVLLNDVPTDGSVVLTWAHFSEDESIQPSQVWDVKDGVIICKGVPRGYICTDQEFTNFTLRLEWRWPENKKPGRGGVLIRTTGEDKIWPKSLEAQINSPSAGDFWGITGYNLSGPADRYKEVDTEKLGKLTNLTKTHDAEKPPGEWNLYEIIADGPVVTLKINGQVVNRATGCDVVPGKICITSEGDEIHFRNIRLIPGNKPTDKK